MNAQHRRWLITGAASGFGRALADIESTMARTLSTAYP